MIPFELDILKINLRYNVQQYFEYFFNIRCMFHRHQKGKTKTYHYIPPIL